MGKRRNLNGLPNGLVQSYFSTLNYYDKGYMPCWIWKKAIEFGVYEFEIDVLNKTTAPMKMNSKPIIMYLDDLKEIIIKTLKSNQFDKNYIVSARLKIQISKQDVALSQVSCQGILEDKEGRIYTGKVYKERAFPIADSLFEKIFKLMKKTGANNR